jgi:predicted PurR-regulated permease PerM
MSFLDRRTADILLTTLAFATVCAAVYSARHIILIFVFAIFFAYLINPIVKFLQRHSLFFRNLRGPAVVEVYLAFVILMALTGYVLAPNVTRNTVKLMDEVPVLLDGLSTGNIATELRGEYGWTEEQEVRFRALLARHRGDIQGLVAAADQYLSNAAQLLAWLLLIPVLAIFFLRDGDHIADIFIKLFFPANRRPRIRAVAKELHVMLTRYIRAQVLLCGLSFLFYSGTMLFLQFPHAIALGVLGGLLEFVPAIGWISTAAAIVGVGIVNHSHWVLMAILLGLWRVIQDYYAAPRIMGSHLKIHPLAAIFGVLAGAKIGGIAGIYLAVPLMASMRLIWRASAGEENRRDYHSHSDVTADAPSGLVETVTI